MDISYCDDKTGFPRPGHNYNMHMYTQVLINFNNAFNNMSKLLRIVGDFLSNAQKYMRSG